MQDQVLTVKWDEQPSQEDTDALITGSITVATTLAVGVTLFIVSGIVFNITYMSDGGTRVNFSYSGHESLEFLKTILHSGVEAIFE